MAVPTERTEADPARPGRGVRLLRLRAARAVVGQSQAPWRSSSSAAGTARCIRATRPWPATTVRPEVLHAGHGQREAPRRESRLRPATAVGHAGASRGRPGRLNALLLRAAWRACERISGDNTESVGLRFEQDRPRLVADAERRFDACVLQTAQVDKYQTVRFDGNAYSVPRRWAFRAVTVKGYVDRVEVVADGQVVARHARLRPRRTSPRPAAFPGGAGAQAGGAGPRPGLPRLAIAAGVRRPSPRPGSPARPAGRRPALHPRPATARRPSAGACRAGDRVAASAAATADAAVSPDRSNGWPRPSRDRRRGSSL